MPTSAWPKGRIVPIAPRGNQPSIKLAVHEAGSGPAVVFCHGFPELAYSWRHQLSAVAAVGFRAIAPDQRGYADSSAPAAITDYGLTELTGDLLGLLDALEIERAVFVGHDWGGFVAWAMPVLHPERTAGVIGVCTPYMAIPPTSVMRTMVGGKDERHYILWFQEPGRAESVMDSKARIIFDRLMRAPVSPEESMKRFTASGEFDMNPFRRIEESHTRHCFDRDAGGTRRLRRGVREERLSRRNQLVPEYRSQRARAARRRDRETLASHADDHRAVGRSAASAPG